MLSPVDSVLLEKAVLGTLLFAGMLNFVDAVSSSCPRSSEAIAISIVLHA